MGDALATRKVVSYRALPAKESPVLMQAVDAYTGYPQTRIALELLMLTMARSGELRAAQWSELDMEAATCTIPAARIQSLLSRIVGHLLAWRGHALQRRAAPLMSLFDHSHAYAEFGLFLGYLGEQLLPVQLEHRFMCMSIAAHNCKAFATCQF